MLASFFMVDHRLEDEIRIQNWLRVLKISAFVVLIVGVLLGTNHWWTAQDQKKEQQAFEILARAKNLELVSNSEFEENFEIKDLKVAPERLQAYLKILKDLEAEFPKSLANLWGQMKITQIEYQQGETLEALERIRRVYHSHPKIKNSFLRLNVMVLKGSLLETLEKWDEAYELYSSVSEAPSQGPLLVLLFAKARVEEILNKTSEALATYQKISDLFPESEASQKARVLSVLLNIERVS